MANLDTIVDLQIERKTSAVPRASFGTGAFIGHSFRTDVKAALYADIDAVGAVYETTDAEYLAATAFFGQSPRPSGLVIATRGATVVYTPTAANTTTYKLLFKVPGAAAIEISYTSDASALVSEITAGLVSGINGNATLAAYLTATDNTTDLSIVADVAGNVFSVRSSGVGVLTESYTITETLADFLPRMRAVNDAWYSIGIHSRVSADIQAMAALIEPLRRLFWWQNNDSDMITSATTDPGSILKAASFARSVGIYHALDTEYAEMAFMAKVLTADPGSVTGKFKSLAGITPDTLTDAQQAFLGGATPTDGGKNINYYVTVGGFPIVQEGKVAVGEFIDVMRDIDYLHVNMQADVFGVFLNNDKVPFDDNGIAMVESVVRARMNNAVRIGILADNDNLYVTVPKESEILDSDKAIRLLPDVKFGGDIAGAIHFTKIRGTVAV